jgi:glutamate/tyrosine decarboxylase-like PLP-dependent enzyme
MKAIPTTGLSRDDVFNTLESYRENDMPWRDGRTWAYVYDAGEEAEMLVKKAYMSYLTENALDPTVFPSLLRLENEVISMCASHLGGDEHIVGNFTSGGTESIILAVKTARDRARALQPEIKQPEMIIPDTAHAAFHKAAHYLDVKPVIVKVNPKTYRADVDAMKAAITDNTVLLVGSAISYAHGVVDPIEELGQVALEHNILFHVDGCMGGFLLPYFKRLGGEVPAFDFQVPGVTSISMDLHKYGFAAKGASVILYKNKDLRQYQIFACAGWTGYTVINPTVQSTKSGGPLAGAWAILHYMGDDGYMKLAKTMYDATQAISKGIEQIEGLSLLGEPHMNLIGFTTTDDTSVFHITDEMKTRGWYVQPQLGYNDSPANIHLSINPKSAQWVDQLLADLKASVETARNIPPSEMSASIGEMFANVDPSQFDEDGLSQMLEMVGVTGTDLPDRMADINEILNALPAQMREKLLTTYLNKLFQYKS